MELGSSSSRSRSNPLSMALGCEQNKVVKKQEKTNEASLENISIENATYLQNTENMLNNDKENLKSNEEIPSFEVDSIELVTPQLFSDDGDIDSLNQESKEEKEIEMFESSNIKENSEKKEPEMFEKQDSEEDFEIPAFLRRQKN